MRDGLLETIRFSNLPEVYLLDSTSLCTCIKGIRTCYDSFKKSDNGGEVDQALVHKVSNVYKHSSVIEHLVYCFEINGISRAVLQKLCRHRMASFSVKSTQYTLNEFKKVEIPTKVDHFGIHLMSRYIILLETEAGILAQFTQLRLMQECLKKYGINEAKYLLPESYKTNLVFTINARSLQNLFELRTPRSAHFMEIRLLAYLLYKNIPDEHKFLFKDFIKDSDELEKLTEEI